MQLVQPIQSVHLFAGLSAELLALLTPLPPFAWQQPTACPGWTVADVSAHLLGGSLGRLAARRAQFATPAPARAVLDEIFALWNHLPRPAGPFENFADLLGWINLHNAAWVQAARQISPQDLLLALETTDRQLADYFLSLPMLGPAGPAVLWAGETRSLNWFDIAREYTEKWLHQQHIREALGQPLLLGRGWLYPVLDTFLRALPYTYRSRQAPAGTAIAVHISGEAGGDWVLLRQQDAWALYTGQVSRPAARIRLPAQLAWRLFTKGIDRDQARSEIQFEGDLALGEELLQTVAIMA